jgi:hypothetical protein
MCSTRTSRKGLAVILNYQAAICSRHKRLTSAQVRNTGTWLHLEYVDHL